MAAKKRKTLALVTRAVEEDFQRFQKKQDIWVRRMVSALPVHWRRRALREYARLCASSEFAGNTWLVGQSESARSRLSIVSSDDDVRDAARDAARVAFELAAIESERGSGVRGIRSALEAHCRSWDIDPPAVGGEPDLLRMVCERWWLRRLRASVAKRCESCAVSGMMVCRGIWPYASDDGCERRWCQKRRNALSIARAVLRDNDGGGDVPLSEIVEKTPADKAVRRSELMVRIRGCEEWAVMQGMGAAFWTLTTPSRFHAQSVVDGRAVRNEKYAGELPGAGQDYLCGLWGRVRAAWSRKGLRVFGLRVAEPHHDATPHWHLLVFGEDGHLTRAREILCDYALRDSGDEPGAVQHRFTSVKISAEKGSAAGYVAKYVSKNIDGFGVGVDDEVCERASDSVKRCDAWAAAWGIRQFQFFGVPAVGLWRELRKMKGAAAVVEIEAARVAADAGDWCSYCVACGGCAISRSDCKVWAVRVDTGGVTEYGDAAARKVVTVAAASGEVAVRRGNFSIVWGGLRSSRTRVNNCTHLPGKGVQGVIDLWCGGGDSDVTGVFPVF